MTHVASMRNSYRGALPLQMASARGKVNLVVRWIFYAFIASLPYEVFAPDWAAGTFSIPRFLGILLVIGFLFDPAVRPWGLPKTFFLFAAFAAAYTFSSLSVTDDYPEQTGKVYQLLQNMILFVLAYNLFRKQPVARGALWAFVAGTSVSAFLTMTGLMVNVERVEALGGRVGGIAWDENMYAFLLVLALVMLIGLNYMRKQSPLLPRVLSWPLAILLLVTSARTGSRGATLALIAGVVTLIFKYGTFWVKMRNVLLVMLIAMLGFILFSRTEIMVERWGNPIEVVAASGRFNILRETMGMIQEKPLLGWGPAAAEDELSDRLNERVPRSTHNVIMQVLVEVGLLGAVPYCLALLAVVMSAWRGRKGIEDIVPFALWMTILTMQMSIAGFEGKMIWLLYGYGLAASDPELLSVSNARASVARIFKNGPRLANASQ
jgi:O-antigen ligase